MDVITTAPTATSVLDRIIALTMERGVLWAKASRGEKLTEAERGRLLDIHDLLEALWARRCQEKAGIDPNRMPNVVVPACPPHQVRPVYRRGRAKRRAGATAPQTYTS